MKNIYQPHMVLPELKRESLKGKIFLDIMNLSFGNTSLDKNGKVNYRTH